MHLKCDISKLYLNQYSFINFIFFQLNYHNYLVKNELNIPPTDFTNKNEFLLL